MARTPRWGIIGKASNRNRFLADLRDVPAMSVDDLMSQYARLSPVGAPTDAVFWELVDARNALRKFIVDAACREDRLIEVSQRFLSVELPARTDVAPAVTRPRRYNWIGYGGSHDTSIAPGEPRR
ncbi:MULTISPECIES: hypothetical protein [unclassified Rhodococcus (in: high G+C Gram-positive bacteria)]|uniref:hypothetical protein n=1 Tax=unclassified Rhodococcus (in: high G+C Gram-positive bacteria) TaxID=192944 RepID=UPI00207882D5|nr:MULTISPECIES: hypothetical protein [unclassified Rhodococcus (in: high G+C Gram-positive bacteria)]